MYAIGIDSHRTFPPNQRMVIPRKHASLFVRAGNASMCARASCSPAPFIPFHIRPITPVFA
jgi:hypothetical protein